MKHLQTTSVRLSDAMIDQIISEGAKVGRRFSDQARHYIELGMAAETSPRAKPAKVILQENLDSLTMENQ